MTFHSAPPTARLNYSSIRSSASASDDSVSVRFSECSSYPGAAIDVASYVSLDRSGSTLLNNDDDDDYDERMASEERRLAVRADWPTGAGLRPALCNHFLSRRQRTAFGEHVVDSNCIVLGDFNTIHGDYLLVIGCHNTVYGKHCTVRGEHNRVFGPYAYATGYHSFAGGSRARSQRHTGFGKPNGYLARRNTPPDGVMRGMPTLKRMISADMLMSGSGEADSSTDRSRTPPGSRLSVSQPVCQVQQADAVTPDELHVIPRSPPLCAPPIPPLPPHIHLGAPTIPAPLRPRKRVRMRRRRHRHRRSRATANKTANN